MKIHKKILCILFQTSLFNFLASQQSTKCKPRQRQEWDEISPNERHLYIQAINCLSNSKSLNSPLNNETDHSLQYQWFFFFLLFSDDFVWWHLNVAPSVHFTPLFLPFHRLFIHSFEQAVIQTCGKQFSNFTIPYWNIRFDSSNLKGASIFKKEYFGGSGNEDDDFCVNDGQFNGRQIVFPEERCLRRNHTLSLISDQFQAEKLINQVFGDKRDQEISFNVPDLVVSSDTPRSYDLFRFILER